MKTTYTSGPATDDHLTLVSEKRLWQLLRIEKAASEYIDFVKREGVKPSAYLKDLIKEVYGYEESEE